MKEIKGVGQFAETKVHLQRCISVVRQFQKTNNDFMLYHAPATFRNVDVILNYLISTANYVELVLDDVKDKDNA